MSLLRGAQYLHNTIKRRQQKKEGKKADLLVSFPNTSSLTQGGQKNSKEGN